MQSVLLPTDRLGQSVVGTDMLRHPEFHSGNKLRRLPVSRLHRQHLVRNPGTPTALFGRKKAPEEPPKDSGTQKLGLFGLGGKKEEDAPQGKSRASPPKPGAFGKKKEESGSQASRGLFGGRKQESGTQALKPKREPKAAPATKKSGTQPSAAKPGLLGTLKLSINKGRRDQKTVFVAGGTGRLGARIVRALLQKGLNVRAGTRDVQRAQSYIDTAVAFGVLPSDASKRVKLVPMDLADEESIAAAIGNAGKVVQAIGASESDLIALISGGAARAVDGDGAINIVNAAKSVGVTQYIMVTSMGAEKFGLPASVLNLFGGVLSQKRRAEKVLEESGIAYTIVRPGGMERPPDSYKETHNAVLASRNTWFGGQVSRLQVSELVASAAANPDLAENKVLEIQAKTDAPRLDYEDLLAGQPNELDDPEDQLAQQQEAQQRQEQQQQQQQQKSSARRPQQPDLPQPVAKAVQQVEKSAPQAVQKAEKAAEKPARQAVGPVQKAVRSIEKAAPTDVVQAAEKAAPKAPALDKAVEEVEGKRGGFFSNFAGNFGKKVEASTPSLPKSEPKPQAASSSSSQNPVEAAADAAEKAKEEFRKKAQKNADDLAARRSKAAEKQKEAETRAVRTAQDEQDATAKADEEARKKARAAAAPAPSKPSPPPAPKAKAAPPPPKKEEKPAPPEKEKVPAAAGNGKPEAKAAAKTAVSESPRGQAQGASTPEDIKARKGEVQDWVKGWKDGETAPASASGNGKIENGKPREQAKGASTPDDIKQRKGEVQEWVKDWRSRS